MDADTSTHDAEAEVGAKSDSETETETVTATATATELRQPGQTSVPPRLVGLPRAFIDSLADLDLAAPDPVGVAVAVAVTVATEHRHDEGEEGETLLAQQTRSALTPRAQRAPLHLLNWPPELLLYLLRYLNFADIERLRRTCRSLRALASPRQVRVLLGPGALHDLLLCHCRLCLAHDPKRASLLMATAEDYGYPFSSRCVECAFVARDWRMRPGTKVLMGSYESVWVCRWCGRPVMGGPPVGQDQFHKPCFRTYNRIVLFYFIMGWIQLGLAVTAAALAWRYFRGDQLVFGPTVASFILVFYCLIVIFCRSTKRVSYHYTVVLELIITALWIPPVYSIVTGVNANLGHGWRGSTVAALVVFSLNILFRLLNLLGNIVLLCGYRISSNHRPNHRWWRKGLVNPVMMFLIAWTYPQSVEQK